MSPVSIYYALALAMHAAGEGRRAWPGLHAYDGMGSQCMQCSGCGQRLRSTVAVYWRYLPLSYYLSPSSNSAFRALSSGGASSSPSTAACAGPRSPTHEELQRALTLQQQRTSSSCTAGDLAERELSSQLQALMHQMLAQQGAEVLLANALWSGRGTRIAANYAAAMLDLFKVRLAGEPSCLRVHVSFAACSAQGTLRRTTQTATAPPPTAPCCYMIDRPCACGICCASPRRQLPGKHLEQRRSTAGLQLQQRGASPRCCPRGPRLTWC